MKIRKLTIRERLPFGGAELWNLFTYCARFGKCLDDRRNLPDSCVCCTDFLNYCTQENRQPADQIPENASCKTCRYTSCPFYNDISIPVCGYYKEKEQNDVEQFF